jgi:PAS domain S-box-containing protein
VNPAAEKMLGWTATELVGKQMHTTVHHSHGDGSHYEHTKCPIYAAFRDGVVHKVDDEVFWRKDGTSFFVEYTSTPVWDRGSLVGAVIVFRDITERREAEDRLRKALDEVQSLRERLEEENDYLKEDIRQERRYHSIVGSSPAIETVLEQIELVASTDATVIITGESGTGKELIARAIHDASDRKDRPLIRVNCAAVPRELFESEFFGHVKGAFTGATRDRSGRFELADKGTLFLDEVGEIPIDLQGKLLRVLQERQFEPVGSNRTRNIDVRVIAATNRNLKEEVSHGRFREDLYFRLNVFPIQAVPLRDRLDDVPQLAQYFLKAAAQRLKMSPPTLKKHHVSQLCCYDWPGNVRELENVIERAVILSRGGELRFDLPETNVAVSTADVSSQAHAKERILTEAERRARTKSEIETAVRASDGRIFGPDGAAAMLGLKPTTLLSRMKSLGISRSTRT